MKRYEYIKKHATELSKLCVKRKKVSERYQSDISQKMKQNLNAELNFLGMHIEQSEERLSFALGKLLPENAISEYRPSQFQRYDGIRKELENTKFEL